MTDTRNNGPVTRGRPFEPGNPGRPKGSRNKATLAAEALLDGEAETLTRKAIDLANAGDTTALRMCIERILPARKDRPVSITLPPINQPGRRRDGASGDHQCGFRWRDNANGSERAKQGCR